MNAARWMGKWTRYLVKMIFILVISTMLTRPNDVLCDLVSLLEVKPLLVVYPVEFGYFIAEFFVL